MNRYRKEKPQEEWWKYENLIGGSTIAGLYKVNVLAAEHANRVGEILSVEKCGVADADLEITYREYCDRHGKIIEIDKAEIHKVSFNEFYSTISILHSSFKNIEMLEPYFRETKEKCTEWKDDYLYS